MKSGYKILWTQHSLHELKSTMTFLEQNWTKKELQSFVTKLDHTVELISKTPQMFPSTLMNKKNIRKAVIDKNNNLYYQINAYSINILSVFSSQQHPNKRKS